MKKEDAAAEPVPLLRALSKPGAIELFGLAGRGISKSTDAMEELGLTRKQYYSRLRGLIESGLIVGRGGVYRLTALGRIVHRHALPILGRACEERAQLRLLDELEASDVDEEIKEMFSEALEARGIVGFIEGRPVRIIDDYETLVTELVSGIDGSESSSLLTSKYVDSRVVDALLRAAKRGVEVRVLSEGGDASSRLDRARMVLSPKILEALIYYLSNLRDIGEMVREMAVPYSFCIIDCSICFFELPYAAGRGFSLAFKVEASNVGERFKDIFDAMWGEAKPNAIFRLVKKLNNKG